MPVKAKNQQLKTRKDPADVDYAWTDIVIRRRVEDVCKPLSEQKLKLAVRCIGIEAESEDGAGDGAEAPMPEEQRSLVMTTEELLSLSATKKNKIKAFVNMCEAGCKNTGETHVEDFSLTAEEPESE